MSRWRTESVLYHYKTTLVIGGDKFIYDDESEGLLYVVISKDDTKIILAHCSCDSQNLRLGGGVFGEIFV